MLEISLPPRAQARRAGTAADGDDDDDVDMGGAGDRQLVTPGETITTDPAFMRGHGTFTHEQALVASVAGVVERVNKLVSVRPLKSRYNGEIGDVVVGRITELGPKRWKVDIKGRQDAVLLLSSINLPGGVQRRKSESDELQMRSFFAEGDLVSAEVQSFFQDGGASLQTRNIKYGKLRNGSLVMVHSAQIKRSKSHFIVLSCGVDVVLGVNGYVWVSKHVPITPEMESDPEGLYSNQNEPMTESERETIARVCNVIAALGRQNCEIHESAIVYAYDASLDYAVKELLKVPVQEAIVSQASALLRQAATQ
ncbi:Exosome complex component rrp4 [Polyrhizophydium stewartii]|uniref:Exosome complex component rrp4 n=1 Tax=Polyrhizophydium stewartii TaxID=2732419 RepID=A0ABR4NCV1_9FUNG